MTKISDFPAATSLDGTELVPLLQDGADVVGTIDDIREIANVDASITVKHLSSTQANSTITPVSITEFETVLAPGTYRIKGLIVYRSAATTTGLQMYVNCAGGTLQQINIIWYQVTTGGANATGIADGATTSTAQMMEAKSQRANNYASGPTAGVDTANADILAVMEGVIMVTAETTLQILFNSAVAASAITLQVGSNLVITKAP